ncbi:hypothetical protein PA598K_02076, partial [Paenibacillus sp. 598K]|uniref:hypothetical protein n=1 Tax=Paenibacillus sp. 598K TaxID=1117987 RepID=UPI000FFAA4F7
MSDRRMSKVGAAAGAAWGIESVRKGAATVAAEGGVTARGAWLPASLLALVCAWLLLAAASSAEAAVLPRAAEEPSAT